MFNQPFFNDRFYRHNRSNYTNDERQRQRLYQEEEVSSLDSSFNADKPYFFEKVQKMNQKSNVKYQQYEGKEPETEISLSESELDKIDEILEKIIYFNQDKKQKYKSLVEQTFETVKNQFVGRLKQEFESLFDLFENYSEFSIFEELVQKFQDNKSDYEMDQTTENIKK